MKARTTLILLVVVVAIGAYIKFYESKHPNTEEAARQEKNVINFNREKLDGIIIQNGDEKIELKRSGNKWRLEAPIKDQADSAAIDNLINDIENWRKTATIPAREIAAKKNQLNEYGLSKPKLRLKLVGADMPGEILFGKDAALEGQLYVRLGNSNDVFIAAQTLKNDVSKKAEDFRDRKLAFFFGRPLWPETHRIDDSTNRPRGIENACGRNRIDQKERVLANSKAFAGPGR